MIMSSSPWTQTGSLYQSHRAACEINPATGIGRDLDTFTLQIPSWALYLDWERDDTRPMWPGGPPFPTFTRPQIARDSPRLQRERERDYANYLVEYEAQWATVSDRYIPATTVARIFDLFQPPPADETRPSQPCPAALHIDLSLSGDNSALAVGRLIYIDGQQHVIFVDLRHWLPAGDASGGQDYYDKIADIAVPLAIHHGATITIDQYQSVAMIDRINARLQKWAVTGLPRRSLRLRW